MANKAPKDYLVKPYKRALVPEENGEFFAEIEEFPGCFASGKTEVETLQNLESVAEEWIAAELEKGREIPKPFASQEYRGKVALRIPKGLHGSAVEMAHREGTSLNQFLLWAIAEKVGRATTASLIEDRVMSSAVGIQNTIQIFLAFLESGKSASEQVVSDSDLRNIRLHGEASTPAVHSTMRISDGRS